MHYIYKMHANMIAMLLLFNLNWPNIFGIIWYLHTLHMWHFLLFISMSCVLTQLKKAVRYYYFDATVRMAYTTCIQMELLFCAFVRFFFSRIDVWHGDGHLVRKFEHRKFNEIICFLHVGIIMKFCRYWIVKSQNKGLMW